MQSLIYFCFVSIDDFFTIYFILSSFLFCSMSDIQMSSVCATNSRLLAAVPDWIIFIKSKQHMIFHDHIQSKINGIKSES